MRKELVIGIASALTLAGTRAFAGDTVNTTFGPLPAATFGGTGIPNTAVETTTISDGVNSVTLGLTATPRFSNPAVGNDGAGTFFANPGIVSGTAEWNFDFYVNNTGGSFANDTFELLYDFTPGVNTPVSELGTINLGTIAGPSFTGGVSQDSENLSFSFLTTGVSGVVTPPTGGSTTFDANAQGQYTFILEDINAAGAVNGSSEINVDIATAPDVASSALLLLLGMGGLLAFSFKQPRLQTVN